MPSAARIVFALALAGVIAACRGGERAASGAVATRGPASGLETGAVWIALEQDGHVRPARLDPRTGAWAAVDGGGLSLFPTAVVRGGELVAIAVEDPVEQLALVRAGAIERFGPRAAAVRNPSASRDGTVLVIEVGEAGSHRDLFRIDPAGQATRLTSDPAGNFEPAVSPDGAIVAFASGRDGQSEIYRMASSGGTATRLTSFDPDDRSPAWSSDGAQLAFVSGRDGAPRVFVMRPDGADQRRVTAEANPDVIEDRPRWAPHGTALAFLRIRGNRSTAVVVRDGAARVIAPEEHADTDLAWSPDGSHVAVVRRPAGAVAEIPAEVVFVRASDGAVVGRAGPVQPLALRWLPGPGPAAGR